jgi:lysyl-tRNA synthetase class 2
METIDSLRNRMQVGDVYEFHGELGHSKSGIESLFANHGILLAPCLRAIPLQLKDPASISKSPVLNYLVNKQDLELLKKRSQIIRFLRLFLEKQLFTEVETPVLSSQCGGANATPFQTKLDTWKLPLYLRIAPELYLKKLVISGFDKVFEIGKQFRNEGIDASHHPEFTTCEVYETFTDLEHVIDQIQTLFKELSILMNGKEIVTTSSGLEIDFSKPFKRVFFLMMLD